MGSLPFRNKNISSYEERIKEECLMTEKRNWKQELKEFWDENKKAIKVGAICLGVGTFYGFIKGVGASNSTMSRLLDKIPYEPDPGDISDWMYSNLDRPEVLEEIRGTLSEIDKL